LKIQERREAKYRLGGIRMILFEKIKILLATSITRLGGIRMNLFEKNKILLATSIAPKNIEIQRSAVDTWLNAGFDVVSLNSSEEVGTIQPFFPDIKFHVVERTAIERYGKPYIYLYDFMSYLKSTDYKVCGIINSDIHFKGIRSGFREFIYREASDALVYGHRVDVADINDTEGLVSNGVDYFFFYKELADIYQDDGLCMGQPTWDWWMVVVAATGYKRIKRVLSRIAFHQRHPQNWYQSLNQYLIESIVMDKYMKKVYPDLQYLQLNDKMWEIVISKNGIEYENSEKI
jgi:hypothetical protein